MRNWLCIGIVALLAGSLAGCEKKKTASTEQPAAPTAQSPAPSKAGAPAAPAPAAPASNPMPSFEPATPAWSPSKIAGPATRAAGKAGQEQSSETSGGTQGQ